MKRSTHVKVIAALLLAGTSAQTFAADRSPVVVELFTSQGCSSCPPANANLIKISKQPNVLALSFAVTYWDHLGWKDSFGRKEFTERQVTYEPALGEDGPFTPQMVVNGRVSAVGNDLSQMQQLITDAGPLSGPRISLSRGRVKISGLDNASGAADVWLVRYDPGIVEVPVARGENSGATLPHTHVVHALTHLGKWSGSAVTFDFPTKTDRLHTAILVQGKNGGPILAAATD
jgi:hypothetical protein